MIGRFLSKRGKCNQPERCIATIFRGEEINSIPISFHKEEKHELSEET
jgi:hypothetical protein